MSASRKKQTLLEWASSELVALLGLDDESVRCKLCLFYLAALTKRLYGLIYRLVVVGRCNLGATEV